MHDADAMNCVPSVEWSVANMRTRGRLMWAWGAVLGGWPLRWRLGACGRGRPLGRCCGFRRSARSPCWSDALAVYVRPSGVHP